MYLILEYQVPDMLYLPHHLDGEEGGGLVLTQVLGTALCKTVDLPRCYNTKQGTIGIGMG